MATTTTSKEDLVNELQRHVQQSISSTPQLKNNKNNKDEDDVEKQQQKPQQMAVSSTNGRPTNSGEKGVVQPEQALPIQQDVSQQNNDNTVPGAYAVVGINSTNNNQGGTDDDDDTYDNLTTGGTTTAAATVTSSNSRNHRSVNEDEPLATSIVEDEEVVRARIQTRITERMASEAVDATNVTSIVAANEDKDKDEKTSKMLTPSSIISMVGFLIIVILVIVLAVPNNKKHDHDAVIRDSEDEAEDSSDEVGTYLQSIILSSSSVLGQDTSLLIEDESTPQYHAFQWLTGSDVYFITDEGYNDELQQDQHVIERYALAVLYFATNGPVLNENQSICDWSSSSSAVSDGEDDTGSSGSNAVRCNGDGLVTGLLLDNLDLNGTLPVELSSLIYLEELSLAHSPNLHGTIPTEYGTHLTRLESFQLVSSPKVTGTFKSASFVAVQLIRL